MDLSQTAIVVSVKIDSAARLANLCRFMEYFEHFTHDAEVIIVEQNSSSDLADVLERWPTVRHLLIAAEDCHWKTRNLNLGAQLSTRPYVIMADCDVVPHPVGLAEGMRKLESGSDFVQLFNGVLVNLTDSFTSAHSDWDGFIESLVFFEPESIDPLLGIKSDDQYPLYGNADYLATGGCTACRRDAFFRAGAWNENFVSYGYEDMEFYSRVQKLGYRFDGVTGFNAYHFDHPRGLDSHYSTFYRMNEEEYKRVEAMTRAQLREYVDRRFRLVGFKHGREYELVNSLDQFSWRRKASRRVDLSALVIVIDADQKRVGYGASCLNDFLVYLENGFASYEVRICEFGGTNYKHILNKANVIYESYMDGDDVSPVLDRAHMLSGKSDRFDITLEQDAELQLAELIGAFEALKARAVPQSIGSIESHQLPGPQAGSSISYQNRQSRAIYICFDDRFYKWARACINSLRVNYPAHPTLLIDYTGTDPEVLSYLDKPNLRVLGGMEIPEFAQALSTGPVGSRTVFRRFGLWSSQFDEYEQILHLDADTLVLGSLDSLFDDENLFFVANHEPAFDVRVFDPEFESSEILKSLLDEDGIAYPGDMDDMANAGVFLLPRSLRTPQELSRLKYLAGRYAPYFGYADQSLLSLWIWVLGVRPSKSFDYNFQTPFVTDETVSCRFDEVKIFHFSSHRKPGTAEFSEWRRVGDQVTKLSELASYYQDLKI